MQGLPSLCCMRRRVLLKSRLFPCRILHRALSWHTEKSVNKWHQNALEPPLKSWGFFKRRVKSWMRVAFLGEEVYCSLGNALCLWPGLGSFGGSRAAPSICDEQPAGEEVGGMSRSLWVASSVTGQTNEEQAVTSCVDVLQQRYYPGPLSLFSLLGAAFWFPNRRHPTVWRMYSDVLLQLFSHCQISCT